MYKYKKIDLSNKIIRSVWQIVYWLFFRFSPIPFHFWRAVLLRLFCATIGKNVLIYPSAKIWAPWNLSMADGSCIGPNVDCYCVDRIELGRNARISQRAFICTAGHDYNLYNLPLITAPIIIECDAWVTAEVYVGPGVTLHTGAVALPRSVVTKDVDPWDVVAGNPAKIVRKRIVNSL